MKFTSNEIREKYDKFAKWYDLVEGFQLYLLGVNRIRRKLLRQVAGKTLEVAAGTGMNFRYYPKTINLTAVDISTEMLSIARKRADKFGLKVNFKVMDAESLKFPNNSFDTVVSALSACTFPNPIKAFQEMERVCKKNGNILLLEHGKSSIKWIAKFQDKNAEKYAKSLGCQWNREPIELAKKAGLQIITHERHFLGVFHLIKARPKQK